jgi:hypothetical protein
MESENDGDIMNVEKDIVKTVLDELKKGGISNINELLKNIICIVTIIMLSNIYIFNSPILVSFVPKDLISLDVSTWFMMSFNRFTVVFVICFIASFILRNCNFPDWFHEEKTALRLIEIYRVLDCIFIIYYLLYLTNFTINISPSKTDIPMYCFQLIAYSIFSIYRISCGIINHEKNALRNRGYWLDFTGYVDCDGKSIYDKDLVTYQGQIMKVFRTSKGRNSFGATSTLEYELRPFRILDINDSVTFPLKEAVKDTKYKVHKL